MFLPLELGSLLLLPLEPNIISVQTLASPLQRRNREQIDSLLETTTLPNLDQAAPDLGIHLPLGLVAFNTSLLSSLNTDMLKIPSQQNFLVDNRSYSLMYHLSYIKLTGDKNIIQRNLFTNFNLEWINIWQQYR